MCVRYEDIDRFTVSDSTHDFLEWAKNYCQGSSRPIPVEDIISAVGRASDAQEIHADAEEANALDDLLGVSS